MGRKTRISKSREEMKLTQLYNPEQGKMRIAGFMSGSGSNLVKIIEYTIQLEKEEGKSPFSIELIFTDKPETSNAKKIADKYNIPYAHEDFKKWRKENKVKKGDIKGREEYDQKIVEILKDFAMDTAAYGGYMLIVTKPLYSSFLGVNVHPADLAVLDDNGKPAYTGDNAVKKVIDAGKKTLRSTTHILEKDVDCGRILMRSRSMLVNNNETYDQNQERLKEKGDWIIFPKTLELIAEGRYAQDEQGRLYFDEKPIPRGVEWEPEL